MSENTMSDSTMSGGTMSDSTVSENVGGINLTAEELKDIIGMADAYYGDLNRELSSDYIQIVGESEAKAQLFADWGSYIGEVKNPENTADNPFHKSKYAPLDEVLNTTRPVLSKWGFGVFQSPQYESGVVSVRTLLVHKSGAYISFPPMSIPVAKQDAQSVVAGVTYARRAALNPILATYGEFDDDGNTASGVGENAPAEPQQKKGARTKKEPTEADALVAEITDTAKELLKKGVTKADFYGVVEEICGTKQYNLVTDTEKLRQVLEAAKGLRAKEDDA